MLNEEAGTSQSFANEVMWSCAMQVNAILNPVCSGSGPKLFLERTFTDYFKPQIREAPCEFGESLKRIGRSFLPNEAAYHQNQGFSLVGRPGAEASYINPAGNDFDTFRRTSKGDQAPSHELRGCYHTFGPGEEFMVQLLFAPIPRQNVCIVTMEVNEQAHTSVFAGIHYQAADRPVFGKESSDFVLIEIGGDAFAVR